MKKNNLNISSFSLAKKNDLRGDDFYATKTIGNLTVAVVCDGVGSAQEGYEAAKRTTNYLINSLKQKPKVWTIEKSIKNFINSINTLLYQDSQVNYGRSELVTTLAIIVIDGNHLYGANVGDSRVYLDRRGDLTKLSFDHVMEEEGYQNVLLQAIGLEQTVEPYYFENIIQNKDRILLCSDGLYNVLDQSKLQSTMALGAHTLVKKASKLVDDNLPDDTTAIILEVIETHEIEKLKQQELKIASDLKSDQKIDDFTLMKSLIQNNKTWLCSKNATPYVLKFAPEDAQHDEGILDTFVKEVWNAKRVQSDYFPSVIIPKNRSYRYYVMEYLNGTDLKKHLKQRKMSIDDTIMLAKKLLKMSQFLLNHDLVHGDIKPENIIVYEGEKKNLDFKIIDFGSIIEIFSITSKAGTPSFLAPERFQNEPISESTEIFAVGVTLYLALTGKFPYGEIEPFQTPLFKESKKPSFYNKNIPDWLDSVILRSLTIDPEQRYKYYSEMLFEIENPHKVKPYFKKNTPIIEKSPTAFYRVAFAISFIINVILTILHLRY